MTKIRSTAFACILTSMASGAGATEMYVSGNLGINDQDSSFNQGTFNADFTTGAVTGVTPPLTVPAGAPVGWTTGFDSDLTYSLALGWQLDNFRVEIEYAMSDSDVKYHAGVEAAGIDLTPIDAGVLLTGNVGDLGVSVGDLVAAGQGSLESDTFYVNFLYDFMRGNDFSPYVGLGAGYTDVDVQYIPSGVSVIDDGNDGFAYQLILGASYSLSEKFDLYGNVRFRDADDVRVQSPLLTATFDIENSGTVYDFGVRYRF